MSGIISRQLEMSGFWVQQSYSWYLWFLWPGTSIGRAGLGAGWGRTRLSGVIGTPPNTVWPCVLDTIRVYLLTITGVFSPLQMSVEENFLKMFPFCISTWLRRRDVYGKYWPGLQNQAWMVVLCRVGGKLWGMNKIKIHCMHFLRFLENT